jgi:hypothetical protein
MGQWGHLEKRGAEYVRTSAYGPYARFWNRETHMPCNNPPFGELVAVDLASGDVAWRSVLGTMDALEAIGVHNTGAPNLGGSIATAGGLVFIAASSDQRFRAFDSANGKLLWETRLEANGHTSAITYMGRDGRQYVALTAAAGGGSFGGPLSDTVVAFALPEIARRPLPASVSKAIAEAEARRAQTKLATPAPSPNSGTASRAMVEKACGSGCHPIEAVTKQRLTRAQWNSTVRSMVARGAELSEAEIVAIVEYLAKMQGAPAK